MGTKGKTFHAWKNFFAIDETPVRNNRIFGSGSVFCLEFNL